jgi:hypothetical protein
MRLTVEEITYMINHVFLPLKLPHKYEADSSLKDATLLSYTAQVAQSFLNTLELSIDRTTFLVSRRWRTLVRMLENTAFLHRQQYLTRGEVEKVLREMRLDGQFKSPIHRCSPG